MAENHLLQILKALKLQCIDRHFDPERSLGLRRRLGQGLDLSTDQLCLCLLTDSSLSCLFFREVEGPPENDRLAASEQSQARLKHLRKKDHFNEPFHILQSHKGHSVPFFGGDFFHTAHETTDLYLGAIGSLRKGRRIVPRNP